MSRNKSNTNLEDENNNDDADGDSLNVVAPDPIELVDHTSPAHSRDPSGDDSEGTASLAGIWAKDVVIDHYDTIQGSTKAGAYVVYLIRIETYLGDSIWINRRYSEFFELREALVQTFPRRVNEIPTLPPKALVSKFRPKFLKERQTRLQYFLLCVLLNPVFASHKLAKDFVRKRI